MKRLFLIVCTLALLIAQNAIFPQTADAAAAIKSLDTSVLIGMTDAALIQKYGKPVRQEPSEYGFTWYIYNKDLKNFFMAGVRDGAVVAVYTNAKTMNYQGQVKLNSTRAAAQALLGTPICYIQSGNTICALSDTDQRDIFPVGDKYVIVYYDLIKGGKVTSIMIVPIADEDNAMLNHPELTGTLLAAYQRISIDLINAVRVRSGLRKLTTNKQNNALALSRSTDMRDRDYFSHYTPEKLSPFDQAKNMGIKYSSMGENIAYGNHNAIIAHEAFMNSAGHRSNVLKAKYTKIGAGAAWGGSRYVLLTNIFSK